MEEEMEVISCNDGIQNGNETGIDCGGDCGLCGPPSGNEFYYYGIIDGEEVILSGVNGNGAGYSSCDMNYNVYVNGGSWATGSIFDLEPLGGVNMRKSMSFNASVQDFYGMYAEGEYSYDPLGLCTEDFRSMPVISWYDESGERWSSDMGVQGMDSYFEVTNRGEINGLTSIIEGKFSCDLYKGSESKKIESGEFRILLLLD